MGNFFSCIWNCFKEAFPAWGTLALAGAVVGFVALAGLFGLSLTTPAGVVISVSGAAVAQVIGVSIAGSVLGALIGCIFRCFF